MRKTTIFAVGLLLAATLAGCGKNSDDDPSVATAGNGTAAANPSAASSYDPVQYTKCMRENGVPEFPDMTGQDVRIPDDIDKAKLGPALQACRKYAPTSGKELTPDQLAADQAKSVRYSQCMRANGMPDFPDPPADGSGINLGKLGIDPKSAAFQAANEKCRNLIPTTSAPTAGGNG